MNQFNPPPSPSRRTGSPLSLSLSPAVRGLVVLVLTGLCLLVWTVTMVGVGVLRRGGPQPASAGVDLLPQNGGVSAQPGAVPASVGPTWRTEESPTTSAADQAEPGIATAAPVTVPDRDPFRAVDRYFTPQVGAAEGAQADEAGKGEWSVSSAHAVPLKIEAVMMFGDGGVAIVHGNRLDDMGGRSLLVMHRDASGEYLINRPVSEIEPEDLRMQLSVGQKLEVRELRARGSHYALSRKAEVIEVSDVTRRVRKDADGAGMGVMGNVVGVVVFRRGGTTYEREMSE